MPISIYWKFLSDIKNLPDAMREGVPQSNDTVCKNRCSPGSKCFCHEDSSTWLLGKETNTWKKIKTTTSGSSSEGIVGDEIEPIPFSFIASLFS